jgi:hypothetical protein
VQFNSLNFAGPSIQAQFGVSMDATSSFHVAVMIEVSRRFTDQFSRWNRGLRQGCPSLSFCHFIGVHRRLRILHLLYFLSHEEVTENCSCRFRQHE